VFEKNKLTINATKTRYYDYRQWKYELNTDLLTNEPNSLIQITYAPEQIFEFLCDHEFNIKKYPSVTVKLHGCDFDGGLKIDIITNLKFLGYGYTDIKVIQLTPVEISFSDEINYIFSHMSKMSEEHRNIIQELSKCEGEQFSKSLKKSLTKVNELTDKYINSMNQINSVLNRKITESNCR
jgi:hypothetical protein